AEEVADKRTYPYTYIGSEKAICFPLTIRSISAGDRMTYDGLSGTKKVQRIFIDEKVPKQKRASWPILTDADGEILWVIGLRKNTKITPQHVRYIGIEIGHQLTAEYEGKFPLVIGVLKGATLFMSDLARNIETHVELDFMDVSSYGSGMRSTGEVKIIKDLNAKVEGRDLLIVEDIIDS